MMLVPASVGVARTDLDCGLLLGVLTELLQQLHQLSLPHLRARLGLGLTGGGHYTDCLTFPEICPLCAILMSIISTDLALSGFTSAMLFTA